MSFTDLSLPDQLSLLFLLALVCIGWWQLLFWFLNKLGLKPTAVSSSVQKPEHKA